MSVNGQPAAFVPVSIDIQVRSFKRTLTAITDSNGTTKPASAR